MEESLGTTDQILLLKQQQLIVTRNDVPLIKKPLINNY